MGAPTHIVTAGLARPPADRSGPLMSPIAATWPPQRSPPVSTPKLHALEETHRPGLISLGYATQAALARRQHPIIIGGRISAASGHRLARCALRRAAVPVRWFVLLAGMPIAMSTRPKADAAICMARSLGLCTGREGLRTLSLICPMPYRHDNYSDHRGLRLRRRRERAALQETTIQRVDHARRLMKPASPRLEHLLERSAARTRMLVHVSL